MLVELHILQNFAPSNLNRDETGSPKDCEFGGYRRARISSQAIKRAIRNEFKSQHLLPEDNLATRTRWLVSEITRRLTESGRPQETAGIVARNALRCIGLDVDNTTGRTEYLLYLGESDIQAATALCIQHWDALAAVERQASQSAIPRDLRSAMAGLLDGGRASDLALFGRMLADLPDRNIDAASQVAHAISTNRVSMEFDFYTAVDDLLPEGETGAGMMGTVEFNSACFYRYSTVDLAQLMENLDGDEELARATLRAFLRASVDAIPTGKQNSFAAHNRPSLVMAAVRESGLCSLANAFLRPVRPGGDSDLVQESVRAMDAYWGRLTEMYGREAVNGPWVATMDGDGMEALGQHRVPTVAQLVDETVGAASFSSASRE